MSKNARWGAALLFLLGAGLIGWPAQPGDNAFEARAATYPPGGQQKVRILVDSIHAHNKLKLGRKDYPYAYHNVYRYQKAFEYLGARGVEVQEKSSGRLELATLKNYQVVFINLVSADLPPYSAAEIRALVQYTREGGSLFFITDHSNCYYHSYKLQPLFQELDIRTRMVTACDFAPNTLSPGNAWINISRFRKHPVTAGLGAIAFQTGGAVDERFAVAHTSPRAWGDNWGAVPYGEGQGQGNYGNWVQDADEPTGALGVVMAKTFGRGRIAVVADQNLFGDPFLNYQDNYRLWLNTVSWLSRSPALAAPEPYRAWRPKRVVVYEDPQKPVWANTENNGYYNLFVDLGRRLPLFARTDLSFTGDVLVFAHADYQLPAAQLGQLLAHLRGGGNVVILGRAAPVDQRKPLGDGTGREATPAATAPPASGLLALVEQLKAALGPAQIADQEGAMAWAWPETGQVVLLPPATQLHNVHIAIPEKEPDTVQRSKMNLLVDLLEGAMPTAPGS